MLRELFYLVISLEMINKDFLFEKLYTNVATWEEVDLLEKLIEDSAISCWETFLKSPTKSTLDRRNLAWEDEQMYYEFLVDYLSHKSNDND